MSSSNFEVIHNVARDYLQQMVQHDHKKFRHLVGSRNGQCIAYFIIDYNATIPIDLHVELQCFNNILSEHDINGVWNKIHSFEVKENDVFNSSFNMSCYSFYKV